MTAMNGHANDNAAGHASVAAEPVAHTAMFGMLSGAQFTCEKVKELFAELEVPFDPFVIEWRVTNTTKGDGPLRGQVIPYADQRAYTDRLNALFSPAGWTRKYGIHTSANFQRGKDEKIVAKVFVSCDLTIFGLGSHSATGEEWADDDNAGTSAEAQAFKRACSCFGLGRYLYHFTGAWVDLDDKKRPRTKPALTGWATPDGWRNGLRPARASDPPSSLSAGTNEGHATSRNGKSTNVSPDEQAALVRQIEAMAEPLGKGLYRGLLKTIARVWIPGQIQDVALLRKVFAQMQSAERGLRRLEAAVDKAPPDSLVTILHSLNLNRLDRVDNLETLRQIVVALEAEGTASDQF